MNKEQQSRETVKYEIPRIEVVELSVESIICTSDIRPQRDEPEDIGYGGAF